MVEVFFCLALAFVVFSLTLSRYYTKSAKFNREKAYKACQKFEAKLGDEALTVIDSHSDVIFQMLKGYTIRELTMLRFGVVLKIYETRGSDGCLSYKEEALLDKIHSRYKKLYELVNQSLPTELQCEYQDLSLQRKA